MVEVERWGMYEVVLDGPQDGNPFLDVELRAQFRQGARTIEVGGFYDGDGTYRIRFMPDAEGLWAYVTSSDCPQLDGHKGGFVCVAPSADNHGPVVVRDTYHFGYADGTPYYPFGTTCYAWVHQGDELEEQTLSTLKGAPFNKVRMCVFPKDYIYNKNEPMFHPFERRESGEPDCDRFLPAFFRHLEQRVRDLLELGIEADIIVFHPYDRTGLSLPAIPGRSFGCLPQCVVVDGQRV
jgi:hypothetical protein